MYKSDKAEQLKRFSNPKLNYQNCLPTPTKWVSYNSKKHEDSLPLCPTGRSIHHNTGGHQGGGGDSRTQADSRTVSGKGCPTSSLIYCSCYSNPILLHRKFLQFWLQICSEYHQQWYWMLFWEVKWQHGCCKSSLWVLQPHSTWQMQFCFWCFCKYFCHYFSFCYFLLYELVYKIHKTLKLLIAAVLLVTVSLCHWFLKFCFIKRSIE